MTPFWFAYVTGLVILALLGAQALADGHPKAWRQRRADRKDYTGRHRADGLSTDQQVAAERRARQEADTAVMFLPDLDEAPLCPPTYPVYDHHLGAGRYAHLRTAELDATVERDLRRLPARPMVDLDALKVYSPYGTPETVDEWAGAVT